MLENPSKALLPTDVTPLPTITLLILVSSPFASSVVPQGRLSYQPSEVLALQ